MSVLLAFQQLFSKTSKREEIAAEEEVSFTEVIDSGDFKIDLSPIDGRGFDLHAFARYGQKGVLAP